MTDITDTDLETTQDELTVLKARADLIGVTYHPSIKVDKLREKLSAELAKDVEPEVIAPTVTAEETESQMKRRLRDEARKLVRVRVTCMNPAKKEWQGEIFTVGNSVVGTMRNFVPFNAEDGWHIPAIILQAMEDRMCQVFTSIKDSRGNNVRKGKLIKEFAIEYLAPLTEKELKELAAVQAATKSLED
jgi:hypothetical protein